MGCQYCQRETQVFDDYEPKIEPKKIKIKKVFKNIKFLIEARKFIKIFLSEDEIYNKDNKALNYILLFSDEQFEHFFQGNDEYNNYPYLPLDKRSKHF